MSKQLNIPTLRFPEFKGEWERKKLGEVAEVYDGTHQTPNYVKEGIPFYSVEQITANDFNKTLDEDIDWVREKRRMHNFKKGWDACHDEILNSAEMKGLIEALKVYADPKETDANMGNGSAEKALAAFKARFNVGVGG